ncbi:hypothetical protein HK104_007715, partial [Borealophlyctis nickersoniae]
GIDTTNQRKQTRLTLSATTCALNLLRILAEQAEQGDEESTTALVTEITESEESLDGGATAVTPLTRFWERLKDAAELLHALAMYSSENRLYATPLSHIAKFLDTVVLNQGRVSAGVGRTIARLWIAIATGLDHKVAAMSFTKFVKFLGPILDEFVEGTREALLTLVTVCCALGQRPPSDLADLMNESDMDAKLYELVSANTLHTGPSLAPTLGFTLLRTLTTLSGPTRLKPIIANLISLLDEGEDVSGAVVGFLAEY